MEDATARACARPEIYELTLPWPPSVNQVWRRTDKRWKAGKIYVDDVVMRVFAERKRWQLRDRLQVTIDAFPPNRQRRDLDNILKPVLDALRKARVYGDDSQIDALTVRRCDPVKDGRIGVSIEIMGG